MALIKNRLADEMNTYKNKRAAALSGTAQNAAAMAAADILKNEERADLNSSASLPALLPIGTAPDTDGALLLPSVKDTQYSFNPERDENGRLTLPSAGITFNGKTGNEIKNRLADEALTYKDRRSAALSGAEKYGADKALQLGATFDTDGKILLPSVAGSPFKDNSGGASADTGVKDDSGLYVFNPDRDVNGKIALPSVLPTTIDRLKNNTIRTERDDRAQFISPNVSSKKTLTAVTDPNAFKSDTQKTAEYAASQLGRGFFVDAPSNFANTVGSVYAGVNAQMNANKADENGMLPLQNPAEMKKIYNEAAADYIANSDFTKNIKEAEALSEEAGKGLGSGAKIIGDVSYNIGNMLPSVIISAVSGGAGAPAALKSLLSSGFIAATSYSSAVSEALSEGADADDAMNYGILIAVTEAVGDQLIGGVGSIGEGLLSKSMGKAVTKLFNNIKNESLRAAVKTGADYITKSLLGEGIEEAIETIAGTGAKRITYDKDAAIDWNEVLYSALMGGITGGVYGSFEAGGNYRSNLAQSHFKSLGETLNDPTSVQALIETGLNSPVGSDSYVITTELQNKEKTGQKITDEDIGRLWAANIAQVNSENDTERANLVYKAQEEYENGITGENAKATNALFDAYGVKKRGEGETADGGEYYIGYTQDNTPFVRVDTDILANVPKEEAISESGRAAGASPADVVSVSRVADELGIDVRFYRSQSAEYGYTKNGIIYLNAAADNPVLSTFAHELTHTTEGTEAYRAVLKYVQGRLGDGLADEREKMINRYAYYGVELNDSGADAELTAEIMRKYFLTDERNIRNMVGTDLSLGEKVADFFDGLAVKLAGKPEAMEARKVTEYYRKAVKESRTAKENDEINSIFNNDGNDTGKNSFMLPETDVYNDTQSGAQNDTVTDTEAEGGGEKTPLRSELNAKGRQYLDKVERKLGYSLANALNIPYAVRRDFIKPTVSKLSDAYLENGSIDQKLTDELFDSAYNEGRVIEREFYDNYKDLKKEIRETKLKVSDAIRGDIADYNGWRKKLVGTLRLSGAEGLPVDTYYQELSDRYPDLFPPDIENPTDELLKIAEVAQSIQIIESGLDHYYGNNADLYRESQKRAFNRKLQEYYVELDNVRRYAEDLRTEAKETEKADDQGTDMDERSIAALKEGWELARRLSRESERAVSRNLLSSTDNKIVKALLDGYIKEDQIPDGANRQGILEVYEAKRRYKTVKDGLDDWNRRRKSALYKEARKVIGDTTEWKDKSAGFLYARETFERNIRDIAPDSETAEKVIDTYRTPIRKNEAARIKYLNSLRDKVRALNISRKVQKGNTVSESEAVQHIGEVKYIISTLKRDSDVDRHRTGLTKAELKLWLDMFMADNPNLDYAKIDTAISKMHEIYDGIYKDLTDSEVRNGYMPTEYRKGYWPHFSEDTPDTLLASFASKFGMDLGGDTLPTTINGITQTFKPGKQYFGHSKQRKGDKTVFDAVRGFDQYIEGASNVIFHTGDIQRLRALSEEIRMSASDDSIRERVMKIRNDDELSEEKKNTLIMKELEDAPTALSNFVVDLEEYTNLLAGKKSKLDRGMESLIGRRAYNVCKTIESRIAANMVSINPGSWLTNFIPIHQAGAAISDGSMLKGMFYTLKSIKESDGIDNMSDFLVMRRSSDPLYRKTSEKISDLLSSPMSWIDSFAAGTIVRGRYFDNLKKGMNDEAALAEADSFASSVMAGRAKGDMPTLFGAVNPLTKLLTQFQLEQNNQLSYLLKDLPAEAKKNGGAKRLVAMLVKFAMGAYLFNDLYEYIVGRRPAFDVTGILNDTVGDFTGYELPNVAELGSSMVKELRLPSVQDFRTEKKSAEDALENLRKNVVEELPFVGGLIGGGRLPISSALPDLSKISSAVGDYSAGEATGGYAANVIGKELLKPAAYLLPPFGGGQIKKAIEGIDAVSRNGSRTIDKEGNELLQYPVYNDDIGQTLRNYVKAITFGKTSLKEGQDWIDRGFGSLSAKATSTYDGLMEEGVSGRDAYGAVSTVAEAKKTDNMSAAEAKRAALSGYEGLEDAGKFLVYYNMLAHDSTDEKEYTEYDMMTDASELGGDKGAIYRMINDIANAEKLSGKLKTFHESKELGNDVKAELYFKKYASDSQIESLNMLESRGVNKEVYYTFLAGKSVTGAKTRDSVLALIDAMNITDAQKDALYDACGYAESTKSAAPWNKTADFAANGGTGIPVFPELNLPDINLPDINLPELTVPEITLPSINLPEISLPAKGG